MLFHVLAETHLFADDIDGVAPGIRLSSADGTRGLDPDEYIVGRCRVLRFVYAEKLPNIISSRPAIVVLICNKLNVCISIRFNRYGELIDRNIRKTRRDRITLA